jgi:hypothetical protein
MSPIDPEDERLAAALRAVPTPATPPGLNGRVRGVIRRRQARAKAAAVASMTALALVVILWRPWEPRVSVLHMEPIVAREIPAEDLEVLFAPPPVDGLTILAARNDVSVAALGRLEGVK